MRRGKIECLFLNLVVVIFVLCVERSVFGDRASELKAKAAWFSKSFALVATTFKCLFCGRLNMEKKLVVEEEESEAPAPKKKLRKNQGGGVEIHLTSPSVSVSVGSENDKLRDLEESAKRLFNFLVKRP